MFRVAKFGGSSLATCDRVRNVAKITKEIAAQSDTMVLVVSAIGGITDQLIACARIAEKDVQRAQETLQLIKERHYEVYPDEMRKKATETKVLNLFSELDDILKALTGKLPHQKALPLAKNALSAQSTTSHLSHDLHYYKAKFFPRLVRSSLNVCAQRIGNGTHRVFDNFAGSGTTLLESALLGMSSVGVDIDPLSVAIARAKMNIWQLPHTLFAEEVERASRALNHQTSGQLELFAVAQSTPSSEQITFPH